MTQEQFEAINGRQQFSNWIIIGHALNGLVENRPLKVIDIGMGTGTSTKVLANFVPKGSEIIGYDLSHPLAEVAKKQTYPHRSGEIITTEFVAQSITETFHNAKGEIIETGSVDYINSSGIIGHHLDASQLREFAAESRRVLKPRAYVALDEGPAFSQRKMIDIMEEFHFAPVKQVRVFRGKAVGQIIFQKLEIE